MILNSGAQSLNSKRKATAQNAHSICRYQCGSGDQVAANISSDRYMSHKFLCAQLRKVGLFSKFFLLYSEKRRPFLLNV